MKNGKCTIIADTMNRIEQIKYGQYKVPYTKFARLYIKHFVKKKQCSTAIGEERKRNKNTYICITYTPKVRFIFCTEFFGREMELQNYYTTCTPSEFVQILKTLPDKNK